MSANAAHRLARLCFRIATLAALAGTALGVVMGASEDFRLAPVHAHLNLLGWVSIFLYGLFYRGCVAPVPLGRLQLVCSTAGIALFLPALAVRVMGGSIPPWAKHAADVGLVAGPLAIVAGMVLFTVIVFRTRDA